MTDRGCLLVQRATELICNEKRRTPCGARALDPRGDNRSDRRTEEEAYREKTSHSEVNATGAIVAKGREGPIGGGSAASEVPCATTSVRASRHPRRRSTAREIEKASYW